MDAQTLAMLRALEERLTAIMDLMTDPEGRVQQSQNDTLRIYGDTAQLREVFALMRDQLMALVDATAILVGRFIEHDKRVTEQHSAMLVRLEALAHGVGQADIAAEAAEARAIIQAAEDEQLAKIAHDQDRAAELLSIARMDQRATIKQAVDLAKDEIADAAEQARETLHQEAEGENG